MSVSCTKISSNGPRLILSEIHLLQSRSFARVPITIGDQEYLLVSVDLFILGNRIADQTIDDSHQYYHASMKWKIVLQFDTIFETVFLPITSTIPKYIQTYLYEHRNVKGSHA